jgi:hypothetical protein
VIGDPATVGAFRVVPANDLRDKFDESLAPTTRPVAVCFDPLASGRSWLAQPKVQNRDQLSLSPTATDRHDLVGVVQKERATSRHEESTE